MRTIGAVTASRKDYATCLPVLRRIQADRDLELRLIVTGAHLSPDSGPSVNALEADGFNVAHRLETRLTTTSRAGDVKSMGLALQAFADCLASNGPDMLLVVGDGQETLAAAAAGRAIGVPVAHVHGGGAGESGGDQAFLHAIAKLSHLHFVATRGQARRLRQMGEESWRIEVAGAPVLEQLKGFEPPTRPDLEKTLGARLSPAPALIALEGAEPGEAAEAERARRILMLIDAAAKAGLPALVLAGGETATGAGNRSSGLEELRRQRPEVPLLRIAEPRVLISLMTHSAALVGDGWEGIVFGPSLKVPSVCVGERRRDMERAANVIDAPWDAGAVSDALSRAVDPGFRRGLEGLRNPYGDGLACERIVDRLKTASLQDVVAPKRFFDAWNLPDSVTARMPPSAAGADDVESTRPGASRPPNA